MSWLTTFRQKLTTALAAGASFTLAACYGPSYDYGNYNPQGNTLDRETGQGIPDMEVCATQQEYIVCTSTDETGAYQLEVEPEIQFEPYRLCIHDPDGPANGSYADVCRSVPAYTKSPEINFILMKQGE